MTEERIYIRGELYLSLEVVARIYEVQAVWLDEVCAAGLLTSPGEAAPAACIAALELDRVATIVRLHRGLSMDLESIALALDVEGQDG